MCVQYLSVDVKVEPSPESLTVMELWHIMIINAGNRHET